MNISRIKYLFTFLAVLLAVMGGLDEAKTAKAQGIIYRNSPVASSSDTAEEEARGKAIYDSLQAKQKICTDLKDADYELLGEYFMGQRLGGAHESMNNMMKFMLGEAGEEQMHVVMGKRLSGCDTAAAWPQSSFGFMPMFGMMGGWSNYDNFNQLNNPNNMMNFGYSPFGFEFFGPIFMIIFWGLVIVAIVALVRWLAGQSGHKYDRGGDAALDILKERYAKGEIDKKEFEEKKKDLS